MLRLKFEAATAERELARDEAMLVWADSIVEDDKSDQPVARPNFTLPLGGSSEARGGRALDPTPNPPWPEVGRPSQREGEGTHHTTELFRTWTFQRPTVVLGRSSKINDEVDRAFCKSESIEVLRRCTGGASVVGGLGCLMYSVVIATPGDGGLRKIDVAHDYVMQRVLSAVQRQLPEAERLGICDLTLGEKKFSGNSLRVARHHLLYHGTILLASDLSLIARCLEFAPRQPEYRRGREHGEFITNINVDEPRLVDSLAQSFEANTSADARLHGNIEKIADQLFDSRYGDPAWHERR